MICLAALKNKKAVNSKNSVSVIIAARNEEANLPKLLKSLAHQKHSDFEVIIINDRSTDNTANILAQSSHYPWLKTINIEKLPPNWNGKKNAILKGIETAQKNVLLFTDADCLPLSDLWIEEMTQSINEKIEVVLGFSPYQKSNSWLNNFIQFETLLTALQYLGFAHLGLPYMAVGRNWALKRNLYPIHYLKEIGHLTGGDDDLIAQYICKSANTITRYSKQAQTSSQAEKSLRSLIRQKTRHLSIGKHYSIKIKTLLSIFSLSYGMSWLLFIILIIGQQWSTALLIFGIRSLSFYIIFIRLGQKLDRKLFHWALPLADFCYPLWYAYLGIRSLAAKQIEWKPENSFLTKH